MAITFHGKFPSCLFLTLGGEFFFNSQMMRPVWGQPTPAPAMTFFSLINLGKGKASPCPLALLWKTLQDFCLVFISISVTLI